MDSTVSERAAIALYFIQYEEIEDYFLFENIFDSLFKALVTRKNETTPYVYVDGAGSLSVRIKIETADR